jgi:hypothetical protein
MANNNCVLPVKTIPVRLEVNLDVVPGTDIAELIERIKFGCNVYRVERVQGVTLVK